MINKKLLNLIALLFIMGGVYFYVQNHWGRKPEGIMTEKAMEVPTLESNADAEDEINSLTELDLSDIDDALNVDLSNLE